MIMLVIGFGLLSIIAVMQTRDVYKLDKQLEQSKDRQGYLEDRLRELEDRIKYIEQTNCTIFDMEDKVELPETDIETVKEAIKC